MQSFTHSGDANSTSQPEQKIHITNTECTTNDVAIPGIGPAKSNLMEISLNDQKNKQTAVSKRRLD